MPLFEVAGGILSSAGHLDEVDVVTSFFSIVTRNDGQRRNDRLFNEFLFCI